VITFEEMHTNDHGLGGKHFWPQGKKLVEQLGASAAQQIEDQYLMIYNLLLINLIFLFCRMSALPPW
jgi:hypothetical protein